MVYIQKDCKIFLILIHVYPGWCIYFFALVSGLIIIIMFQLELNYYFQPLMRMISSPIEYETVVLKWSQSEFSMTYQIV